MAAQGMAQAGRIVTAIPADRISSYCAGQSDKGSRKKAFNKYKIVK
jgi:hypothetical protein